MGDKKKVKNKQNFIPIKKATLQQINYTEELALPTYNTIEIKNIGKSIELKKQNSLKKPVSRKSRCGSVKQTCASVKQSTTVTSGPIKFKHILKRFDELKGLQQKAQRSKSKSAKQIRESHKSRSPVSHLKMKQSNSKKFNLTTLMNKTLNKTQNFKTQFNSRMSLTNKLQKTLKKINQDNYFCRDEDDSLIPFISTSDACNNEDHLQNSKSYEIQSQQYMDEDFINIGEMRKFCRTKENQELFESVLKKDISYFRGDQYEMMATRIQKAWRRFRTKKLVDHYADVFSNHYFNEVHSQQEQEQSQGRQNTEENDSSSDLQYQNLQNMAKELNLDLNIEFSKNKHVSRPYSEQEIIRMEESESQKSLQEDELNDSFPSDQQSQDELVPENQNIFYQNKQDNQRLVTYISNLDEDSSAQKTQQKISLSPEQPQSKDEYMTSKFTLSNKSPQQNHQSDFLIGQIKQMELEKWKEVIELLEQSKKKKNPNELESILTRLEKKSEKNKKELEDIQKDQLLSSSNRKSEHLTFEEKTITKRQESGPSQTSDLKKEEEFDSRKYIEYLDSDMYLVDRQKSSQNSQFFNDQRLGRRISKRKQNHLLAVLDIGQAPPIRLKCHCFSKSQNLSYLMQDSSPYVASISHRLNKSISQKNIQKVIKSFSPQLEFSQAQNQADQMNLDLIRQQFLESSDSVQELQKLHTNQQLRMKIKQSLNEVDINLMEDDSSQQEPVHPVRINIDLSKTFDMHEDWQGNHNHDYTQIQDYLEGGDLNFPKQNKPYQPQKTISLQRQNQFKSGIVIETIDKNIEEENQKNEKSSQQENQKTENVAFMIYNTLILEVLRQIATYDTILQKFKDYSLSVKTQQQKQFKKGFQTNHTEVKNYVQGLISFLLNQEPQVFKNLEVPAGPTALQMLHYMHPNECDDDSDEGSNVSQDQTSVMVIPNRMFDKYWGVREKALKFEIESAQHITQQRKKKVVDQLKNLTKMFYRSIFDTFNECLDIQRNYGQAGKPYPWKRTPSFHHSKTLIQIQKSIQNSQKRMTQIATTYCGLIIQKNEMARISMEGSDDYIQHVQEDRMSRMLAQDLIEGEERWTFYDDEELELLVQIGNFITISLVLEAGEEISSLVGFS